MDAQTHYWSVLGQARRVVRHDTRVTGIDLLYSVAYVLVAFFVISPSSSRAVYVAVAPFIALSLVLAYMVQRICGPEGDETTAMFYANLPRGRLLAFWTHMSWFAVFALTMELVILGAVALRLNAGRPDQPFVVAPYMFVLPFFTITVVMWFAFGGFRWYVQVPAAIAVLVSAVALVAWDIELRDGAQERFTVTAMQDIGPALGLASAAGLVLWHAYIRWAKAQVGELG